MQTEIQVAIISGLCVGIPSLVATIFAHIASKKKSEETKNLTIYRIDQLEKKVDKHNNLIDRMYKIENRVTLIEDGIKK